MDTAFYFSRQKKMRLLPQLSQALLEYLIHQHRRPLMTEMSERDKWHHLSWMWRGISSFQQGSGGKEDKKCQVQKKYHNRWILQALTYMTRVVFPRLFPQICRLFLMGHQSRSPSSPQTIHVACPVPQKRMACHFYG